MYTKEKKEELMNKLHYKIKIKQVGRMSKDCREKTVEDIYKKIGISEFDVKALTELSNTILKTKQK